jgi:hypothetical protein
LVPEFTAKAKKRLEKRSRERVELTSTEILDNVKRVRAIVETRFRNTVVSPRTTIHVCAMHAAGFTLREGLAAKLPGLKAAEVKSIFTEANVA